MNPGASGHPHQRHDHGRCQIRGGRTAASAVLDAAGSRARQAGLWDLYRPPEYEPFKTIDRDRWRRGLPHAFDPDQARPPRGSASAW